jgi:nucleoside-triphosphatase THEP1
LEKEHKLNDIWLKAIVIGSLWASSEIILGSFLHNLKVPFAGTILSLIGVIFLVSGSHVWPDKGLIWRSGVICAIMKTISPSADILGPMISIAAEAFLLESAIRIFGKNIAGYILGGGFAVSWSLFYKIAGSIFIFGPNIIELYSSLYKFAIKQLNFPNLSPWSLIVLLFFLYMVLGATAAIVGRKIGKNPVKVNLSEDGHFSSLNLKYNFTPQKINQKYSFIWLALHFIIIVLGLLSFNFSPLWLSSIFVAIYVLVCISLYKQNLKRLKRLKFWFPIIIITLLSGFLLGEFRTGKAGINFSGVLIGVEMNVRAFLMIFGFSSLSIELRNPKIESWFKKRGMGRLSVALEIAFKIFPLMVANISEEKNFFKQPVNTISKLIGKANLWLDKIENQFYLEQKIFLITGNKGSGKTSFLTSVISFLQADGLKIGGIIAPGYWKNNKRWKFDVFNVSSNESALLCSTDLNDGEISTGSFVFTKEGIMLGEKALSTENNYDNDMVIIDEVGPLELEGKGWSKSINDLLLKYKGVLVLVVRTELVQAVISHWKLKNYSEINIKNYSLNDAAIEILVALKEIKNDLPVNI